MTGSLAVTFAEYNNKLLYMVLIKPESFRLIYNYIYKHVSLFVCFTTATDPLSLRIQPVVTCDIHSRRYLPRVLRGWPVVDLWLLHDAHIHNISHTIYTLLFVMFLSIFSDISIFGRVALLEQGQSYDCSSANEIALKEMGTMVNI